MEQITEEELKRLRNLEFTCIPDLKNQLKEAEWEIDRLRTLNEGLMKDIREMQPDYMLPEMP